MQTKHGVFLACLLVAVTVGAAPYPFEDDFESGLANWTTNGTWGLTTASAYSPTHAATDSPGAFYTNHSDMALTLASGMDLSTAVRPAMRVYLRYALEWGYDAVLLEFSDDGGGTWTNVAWLSGGEAAWTRHQVFLDDMAGGADVRFRLRLVTDGSVVMDGLYLDDVYVGEAPAPSPIVATAASQTLTRIEWEASADPDFDGYRIYRANGTNAAPEAFTLVETLADPATTSWVDVAVSPKSGYTYALRVMNVHELESVPSYASVITPAGMDYPFLDTGEGGGGLWIADPPWALTTQAAFSAATAWTDSPDGAYTNQQNVAITLAAPMSLVGSDHPVLCYAHRYHLLSGDNALVEISTNNGAAWNSLASYSAASSGWRRVRHDLSAYTNASQVLVRFRLTTDASGTADGWWLDDITVSESPDVIDVLLPTGVTSDAMTVPWTASVNPLFSHYVVVRSTNVGTGINSPILATVGDPATVSLADSGLAIDTEYFYRVFEVSRYRAFSADGQEGTARTLNNPVPFAEDFEGGLSRWNFSGPWGLATTDVHGGSACLTDSPAVAYGTNTDTWAQTAVDLSGTTWPVLTFHDRYQLAANDTAVVEASPNGSTWTRVYFAAPSTVTNWTRRQIDLSEWRNQANLRIRFRLISDAAQIADGWYLDDITVAEHAPGTAWTEFRDDFEGGLTNWINAQWVAVTDAVVQGSSSLGDGSPVDALNQNRQVANLARPIDLSGSVDPQLTFWLKGNLNYSGSWPYPRTDFYIQMSKDGGLTWVNLLGQGANWSGDWSARQATIPADYRVAGLRLRLNVYGSSSSATTWQGMNLWFDKFSITERPPGVSFGTLGEALKSIDLTWTTSTLGPAFQRYEIYRSPDNTVDATDTLIGVFSNINDTAMTDTGLQIGSTYYYGVRVVNADDTASLIATASAQTQPLASLNDPMESLDNWVATGSWGVDTQKFHTGAGSLTESPVGGYADGEDSSILTSVDLQGLAMAWPVLSFYDRHVLAPIDAGVVEVSPNGSTWTRLYAALTDSQTNWMKREIDLSPWKNQPNLRIRFRFLSDGNLNGEGWNIDDVAITDRPALPAATSLALDFEDNLTNWIQAQWTITASNAVSGAGVLEDDLPTDALNYHSMIATYGGAVDLSGSVDPQITFWMKGNLGYSGSWPYPRADFYVQMSKDDGVSWVNLVGQGANWSADWTRKQAAIPVDYRVANLRLRLHAYGSSSSATTWQNMNLRIDKLTVGERPAGVTFGSLTENLKSIDLTWTESSLGGAFQRYEVYRSVDTTVDTSDTLVGVFSNVSETAMTDDGLEIGKTYFYGILVVDANDTYSLMSTASAQTQPLSALIDPMESLDNWVATGNWGVDTQKFHAGSASLTESPVGGYADGEDSAIMTSVDLQGLGMNWPVLSFYDRHVLSAIDAGVVEVSPNGSSWTRLYAALTDSQTNWLKREIDLSPWKNQSNLRIRFRFLSDGSLNSEGWNIDDVAITDRAAAAPVTGLFADFEDGLTNWIQAQWTITTNDVVSGAGVLEDDLPTDALNYHSMIATYGGTVDLSGSVDPQITFWMKGNLGYSGSWPYPRADFYVQMSKDDGLTWANLVGQGANWSGDWTLKQATVPADYRVANLRVRLNAYGSSSSATTWQNMNLRIDRLVIAERPAGVAFTPPVPGLKSIDLGWTGSTLGGAFQRYELYRSLDTTVDMNDTRIAMVSNIATLAWTDTGLEIGRTYHYGIYVVDDNGAYSILATTSAATVPLAGLNDPMESLANWVSTGTWGVDTQVVYAGSGSVGDSPHAAYPNDADAYILTSVNLQGLGYDWPVLRFRDRHDLAAGDSGVLELSIDGASWSRHYCTMPSTRTNWTERLIDLSPWRTQANLRIKFRLLSDANLNAYGWNLDDVAVVNHTPAAPRNGFYDGFNSGLGAWINGQWGAVTDEVAEGTAALGDDLPTHAVNNATIALALGGPLDLSQSVAPTLSFRMKGNLNRSSSWPYPSTEFKVQISTNNGLTWVDLVSQGSAWSSDWTQRQAVISAPFRTNNVRLRLYYAGSSSGSATWEGLNLWIDSFGIGDPMPGAPSVLSPALYESVGVLRPVLAVGNASDYQSDPLTYRFEVYDDEGLSNLVAQVPSLSGGLTSTAWQVDVNLNDNAQYWWRVRANDGSNDGPWMTTSTFYVNETNAPPVKVVIAGPPKGATLRTGDGNLSWYPTTDPDVGDAIEWYQLQVDEDPGFGSPEIDTAFEAPVLPGTSVYLTLSRPLSSFTGWEGLGAITNYFWRIRAQDTRFAWSPWTDDGEWFIYGVPPPNPDRMQINPNGTLTLHWEVGTEDWFIQWTPSLTGNWQTVAGPLGVNSWTFAPDPAKPEGFYRVSGD